MYKVQNLTYKIENKTILNGINLEIKNNNFLSIIGANGSGKTTLIKAINRNITGYEGNITLDDNDIESFSDRELALKRAILNQSFDFPYRFKAIDIVKMGLYAQENSKKEEDEIVAFILNRLDIENLSSKDYTYLSGGEKQKIQLARVLTQIYGSNEKEKFLFLDEPTLNLDIYYQYKILDVVKELISEFNIGVCAVLHDMNQAYTYSNEIVIIEEGKIKHMGHKNEVLTYKNIYETFRVKSDFVYSTLLDKEILITSL